MADFVNFIYPHRDQIECPMIKEFFTRNDEINKIKSAAALEINKLSSINNNLEYKIRQKYPLLANLDRHTNDKIQFKTETGLVAVCPVGAEYVYYINSKASECPES